MKVSELNRLFTIAAIWDMIGRVSSRRIETWCVACELGECFEDPERCGPGTTMRREIADRNTEVEQLHAELDEVAKPIGGATKEVFRVHIPAAWVLTRQDTREGRRAARIARKSYARVS